MRNQRLEITVHDREWSICSACDVWYFDVRLGLIDSLASPWLDKPRVAGWTHWGCLPPSNVVRKLRQCSSSKNCSEWCGSATSIFCVMLLDPQNKLWALFTRLRVANCWEYWKITMISLHRCRRELLIVKHHWASSSSIIDNYYGLILTMTNRQTDIKH